MWFDARAFKSSKIIELDWQQNISFQFCHRRNKILIVLFLSPSPFSSCNDPIFKPHSNVSTALNFTFSTAFFLALARHVKSELQSIARAECVAVCCVYLQGSSFYYRAVHCDFSLHHRPPFLGQRTHFMENVEGFQLFPFLSMYLALVNNDNLFIGNFSCDSKLIY